MTDTTIVKLNNRIWELEKENEQLKEEIKDLNDVLARYEEKELLVMTEKRFIHLHIIRIDYPVGTDVRDTEPMIKHIKSVITRELGKEPIIEEYLL